MPAMKRKCIIDHLNTYMKLLKYSNNSKCVLPNFLGLEENKNEYLYIIIQSHINALSILLYNFFYWYILQFYNFCSTDRTK